MAIDSTLPNGELLLARYAELLVECGWGGEKGIKGKPVHILHSAPAYQLMLAIAERRIARAPLGSIVRRCHPLSMRCT
jgi:hypothetical protein